jgi:hypothetical protein
MIFCTLCYGDYWAEKYSNDINKISESHTMYVYTNKPEYFKSSCNIIEYKRKDFSYFEKLILLFNIIDKYKERVTYFDCDSVHIDQVQLMLTETHKEFDNETIYSHKIFYYENVSLKKLTRNPSYVALIEVYKQLGFENVICNYIHERITSVPYIPSKFNELKESVFKVQSIWEETWSKGRKWKGYLNYESKGHECNRWSQYGCGYGEGGALSIYANKLNIKLDTISSVNSLI